MSIKQAVEQMEMEIAELTKKLAASEANLERIAFMGMDVPMQGDAESFYQMQLRSCISIAANNSRSTLNAMIAKERQAGRDELLDDISDALQSDLENGVKWLNETASKEFREKYPALNKALCQTELKDNE